MPNFSCLSEKRWYNTIEILYTEGAFNDKN